MSINRRSILTSLLGSPLSLIGKSRLDVSAHDCDPRESVNRAQAIARAHELFHLNFGLAGKLLSVRREVGLPTDYKDYDGPALLRFDKRLIAWQMEFQATDGKLFVISLAASAPANPWYVAGGKWGGRPGLVHKYDGTTIETHRRFPKRLYPNPSQLPEMIEMDGNDYWNYPASNGCVERVFRSAYCR